MAALWLWLGAGTAAGQGGDRPETEPSAEPASPPGDSQVPGPPSAAGPVEGGLVPPPSAAGETAQQVAAPKSELRSVEDIVTVDPGATCLEHARLVQRVGRWLQRTEVEAPLHVHVRGDPSVPSRVFFSVSSSPGASAERRLDNVPTDCDQLHSAVALSIALAIEATLQQGELAKAPPAAPERADEGPAAPLHLELALLIGTSIGVQTDASWAATPRLSFSPWPWFEIAIAGLGAFLEDQTIQNEYVQGSYSTLLWAVGLDLCVGGETTQRFGFYMCAGARGGAFRSQGSNIEGSGMEGMPVRSTEDWWGLTGSGQARFWFSTFFALGGSVEAVYSLRERTLTVMDEEGQTVSETPVPPLGLTVTVGPVFRFF